MGHVKNYTMGDVVTLYRRRNGHRVMHPMGYDAFGLPAENAAIRSGRHPAESTRENIAAIRRQMQRMGWSIDWNRELSTCRARLLPLDAVDLPAPPRGGPGVSQERHRQVVPEGPDGARERAGDRRALRAVWHRGRGPHARPVVLQDHRLCGSPARRPRARAVARAGRDDAAQLDRALARRRGAVHARRRHRAAGLHDAARHALRGDVLRAGAGASAGRRDGDRGARRCGGRVRPPRRGSLGGRARRGTREDRRLHGPVRDQPGERRSRSRSGSPTTCWPSTAPARSWPCRPTTSATSSSPRRTGSRSARSSRRATQSCPRARTWRTPTTRCS